MGGQQARNGKTEDIWKVRVSVQEGGIGQPNDFVRVIYTETCYIMFSQQ